MLLWQSAEYDLDPLELSYTNNAKFQHPSLGAILAFMSDVHLASTLVL
jgi:hypothetical protein